VCIFLALVSKPAAAVIITAVGVDQTVTTQLGGGFINGSECLNPDVAIDQGIRLRSEHPAGG
jgi:hypothetical protein